MSTWQIFQGDCREVLVQLQADSVQCVVTSPPYWGLRDYQTPGQVGLEPDFCTYVDTMVEVFREVRRVLRPDGTVWLNLGDSYAGSWGAQSRGHGEARARRLPKHNSPLQGRSIAAHPRGIETGSRKRTPGLKPKDLCLLPHRVAIALQDDGWWVRGDVVWHKPNPMPESVQDRPTRAHEYIFLLTKSGRYFYDADAVRTPAKAPTTKMPDGWDTGSGSHGSFHRLGREKGRRTDKQRGHSRRHAGLNGRWDAMSHSEQRALGANLRDVWAVPTQPFPGAHFATFPERLIEPCILAGSRPGDTVLDPFAGSGTTLVVALRHHRQAIGIELNPEYVAMAHARLERVQVTLPLDEVAS